MKLKMARNSLFAVLLRSPWWISILIALALGLIAGALLPQPYRAVGALSGLPFLVIGAVSAYRRRHLPSAERVAATQQALSTMAWPAFADLLEQAFVRDGYAVQRGAGAPVDFELRRAGRTTLVCARRWKSARIGLQDLRALQTARTAKDASQALYIALGALSDNAQPFAAQHDITVWQAADLARALRGLPVSGAAAR
jgi:restriction system protein